MRKTRLLVLVVGILCGPAIGLADDTDIFLVAPEGTSTPAPNVLIVLDNSSNWSASFSAGTKFGAEKAALSNVIANLNTQLNVGLMMMDETGTGTTAPTSGSYVRFGVRNMDTMNRTALRSLILNLGISNDKTNNASWAAMFESTSTSAATVRRGPDPFRTFCMPGSGGQARLPEQPTSNTTGGVPEHTFDSPLTRVYNSPIDDEDGCQKNYIIFIGNGMPQSGGDSGTPSAARLLANVGGSTSTIPLPSSTAQSNIADEYARFLSQTDVSSQPGRQSVLTYTIAVYNPLHDRLRPDMISLMSTWPARAEALLRRHGRNHAATRLESIFAEVQAVNSVFASSRCP
jgi:type IV pilus assembly protein PilY1